MGHSPNEIAKSLTKRRGPVPKVSDKNAVYNLPQGVNFTQSANVKGKMAKGKSMGISSLTRTSTLAKTSPKARIASRNVDSNAPKTTVSKSDKGRNTSAAARAKVKPLVGVTRLSNNKPSPTKGVSKSDKGRNIPVKSTKKAAISGNRKSRMTAVSGLKDMSGLGQGGKGGRYKFTARPTDSM